MSLDIDKKTMRGMANAIRALAMDAVESAKSGHPGMPMGMADVATLLFARYLKFDSSAPDWADRDRFVLSAGHGSMLLYALLHLTGFEDVTLDEIKRFRQLGSRTPGHPEWGHTSGVETTTGPLGQGLANAVGMAMAEAHLRARFGTDMVDHRTWVIAGDGCLMEGISQEALTLAGALKLNRLIVIWDDNDISIDGAVSMTDRTDQRARFAASNWTTFACDGHDPISIAAAFDAALTSDRPVLIAAKTTIGFGAPTKAGTKNAHGEPLGAGELAAAKAALGWDHPAFHVPDDLYAVWRAAGSRGAQARKAWEQRLKEAPAPLKEAFVEAKTGAIPPAAMAALEAQAQTMAADAKALATRASSGAALEAVFPHLMSLVGGSADLTGSNNTLVKGTDTLNGANYAGRYIHYGVREHAMAAAMNGMALHGGIIPYGGTFLCFADYSRPAIRLAALMGIRVIHVMTHDSIGLGEDGPTHQPVEHLAALRAIPNLYVFRPCDGVEASECWQAALTLSRAPSVLALSRQAAPALRTSADENLSLKGAYVLLEAEGGPARATLIATGTEVSLAVEARAILQAEGTPTRVVSAPCLELFDAQPEIYRQSVLGKTDVRVVIEAGVASGWADHVGECAFVGMTGFGASAPAKDLYRQFGITTDAIVAVVRELAGED
jgi:transketolase